MSPEVLETAAKYILPVLTAVIAVWGTAFSVRHQKGTRENRLIDQLQEELAEVRKELKSSNTDRIKERAEDQARMARLEARDRIYIPHILKLNYHIEQNLGPPAPDIPELIQEYLRGAESNTS